MSTSAPSISFADQAIEVLRKTEDGNLLARRDLVLLQEVVNGRGQALSERGLARWVHVVETVCDGSYAAAPFCGVPGLSQGNDGYVYWRGIGVEHYSYPSGRHQEMVDSARDLGAVCMTLERSGQEVSSLSVMRFFARLREGPDGPSLRYCALWVVRKDEPRMVIRTLGAETRTEILSEIGVLKDALMNEWGTDHMALRCFAIHSKEDVAALLRGFESDRNWVRQHFWRECLAELQSFPERALAVIDQDRLPSRADFQRALIGPALDQVVALSEDNLAEEEASLQRIAQRERAA